jgi:glycosyltransferase involved in cell wall biosynthesis
VTALVTRTPAISVVIPTYNRGSLVARAVDSALRQNLPPAEIIVIDDGSTDQTADVLARYGDSIRYVRQRNGGASESRNNGVRLATSEWVAFLDSDDLWMEAHLESLGRAMMATGGKAVLYFSDMMMEEVHGGGSLWEHCGFRAAAPYELIEDGTEWAMMQRQPMMLQTSVVRRQDYLALGGLWKPLRTRHDTHFFIKLACGRCLCAVPGVGTKQTSDEDPGNRLMSASGPASQAFWEESIALNADLLRSLPDLPADHRTVLRKRLGNAYWRLARLQWHGRNLGLMLRNGVLALHHDPGAPLRGRLSVRG